MKTKYLLAAAALIPLTLLAITSCSSTSQTATPPPATLQADSPQFADVDKNVTIAVEPGVPGGVRIETYESSATVTAIDAATRHVTVVSDNGATATFKCGTNVINFDQIRVGDHVRATVTRELVISLGKPGDPVLDSGTGMIALAAKGEKPGAIVAGTEEVTATVQSVDLEKHEATLLFPAGFTRTFPVRPDIDLTRAKIGQQVVFRRMESVALQVEDP